MKNFLIIFLFPLIGFGQSPNASIVDKNQWEEPKKKVVPKLFFPNPTYGEIEFDLDVIGHDHISISINNILAKELYTQTIDRTNHKVNVGFLVKGTYLICLRKMDGEVISTRRLVIITH